ncbi:hypothetical protein Dimus_000075 [Dionaea muscipula]
MDPLLDPPFLHALKSGVEEQSKGGNPDSGEAADLAKSEMAGNRDVRWGHQKERCRQKLDVRKIWRPKVVSEGNEELVMESSKSMEDPVGEMSKRKGLSQSLSLGVHERTVDEDGWQTSRGRAPRNKLMTPRGPNSSQSSGSRFQPLGVADEGFLGRDQVEVDVEEQLRLICYPGPIPDT